MLGSGIGEKVLGINNYRAIPEAELATLDGSEMIRIYEQGNSPQFQLVSLANLVASQVPLDNLTAITDPTGDDDATQGYDKGSIWINGSTEESFRCMSVASDGNAVWVNTSLTTDELATVAVTGDFSDLTGTPDLSVYAELAANDIITGDWQFNSHVTIAEIAAPSTPASGYGALYAKAGGKLYWKDDEGAEFDLTSGTSATASGVEVSLYANYSGTGGSGNNNPTILLSNNTVGNPNRIISDVGGDSGVPACQLISSYEGGAITGRSTLAHYNYTTLVWEIDENGNHDYQGNDITEVANISRTGLLTIDASTGILLAYNGTAQLSIEDGLVEVQEDLGVLGDVTIENSDSKSLYVIKTGGSSFFVSPLTSEVRIGTSSSDHLTFYSNDTERARISSTGVFRISNLAGSGTRNVQADSNGNLSAPTSDEKTKNVIGKLSVGIDYVLALAETTIEFRYKKESLNAKDYNHWGFGARASQKTFGKNPAFREYNGVYYWDNSQMIAPLYNAVAEICKVYGQKIEKLEKLISQT